MDTTKIEWCDRTWSPWEGCQKVSPACDFCYAEALNERFRGGLNWGPGAPRRKTVDWMKPRIWNRNAARDGINPTVFPSICDPFDNAVPSEWREEFFELIRVTPHLTWPLLTKRPQNIVRMVHRHGAIAGNGTRYLPDNVRLGTTAENQKYVALNIPPLIAAKRELGARVAFVSIEPMLGPVDLERPMPGPDFDQGGGQMICQPWFIQSGIDWVIAGGESGPHARPAHPEWLRSLRDQCSRARVAFLMKQHGEYSTHEIDARGHIEPGMDMMCLAPSKLRVWGPEGWAEPSKEAAASDVFKPGAVIAQRVGKAKAGRLLDGVEHNGFPRGVA